MNVYDFDGTIYDGDSTVDFYLYCIRRNPGVLFALPKQAFGTLLYMLKKIDKTKFKEYFFSFLSRVDAMDLVEDFWDINDKKIFDWYMNQKEETDIIISASPEFLLKPICSRLGIKHLLASRVNDKTGVFQGKNCRGEEKVVRLREAYGECSIEQFYSDSRSDLPLALLAKEAFLVK